MCSQGTVVEETNRELSWILVYATAVHVDNIMLTKEIINISIEHHLYADFHFQPYLIVKALGSKVLTIAI